MLASCIAAAPGCGALGSRPDEVLINQADLLGTWHRPDGVTLRFDPDHRVIASGPGRFCPSALEGTWEFEVRYSDSSGHSDKTATEGYAIFVDLPGATGHDCSLFPSIYRDTAGYALCLIEDPDTFCADSELLRKTPASTEQKAPAPRAPARAHS